MANLYSNFDAAANSNRQLMATAAYKALDIAQPNDMTITNNTTKTGIATPALIAVAAALGIPGVLLGLGQFFNKSPAVPPAAPPAATSPDVTSKFDVIFFDKDGNRIQVPRLPIDGVHKT